MTSEKTPKSSRTGTHLAEALRWSTATGVDWVVIASAGIGMAGPALLGAALGKLSAGLAASLGSLMVGGVEAGASWRAQMRQVIGALLPAIAAAIVAAIGAGRGWPADVGTVVVVGLVAAVSGYSRPVAVMVTRFIVYLLIAATVAAGTVGAAGAAGTVGAANAADQKGLFVLILAGALWAALVSLVLGAVARAARRGKATPETPPPPDPPSPQPTRAQKRARWRGSLKRLSGWHYTLRLTLCLGVAVVLRWLWPEHHLHWIALTVALLIERQIERVPVRTTQRAIGTALGVLAAGLLLVYRPTAWWRR